MSVLSKPCWVCEVCTHFWYAVRPKTPPQQCPKCRSRHWNDSWLLTPKAERVPVKTSPKDKVRHIRDGNTALTYCGVSYSV